LAGYAEDMLFRLELATDEACTNVIEHAYGGEDQGMLYVTWRIEEESFIIEIQDHGRPFDPDIVPEPIIPNNEQAESGPHEDLLLQLKVGGLGLYFMRKLMDTVQFSFDAAGAGNTLIMSKRLPGAQEA